jgi:hypothetical protein
MSLFNLEAYKKKNMDSYSKLAIKELQRILNFFEILQIVNFIKRQGKQR